MFLINSIIIASKNCANWPGTQKFWNQKHIHSVPVASIMAKSGAMQGVKRQKSVNFAPFNQ